MSMPLVDGDFLLIIGESPEIPEEFPIGILPMVRNIVLCSQHDNRWKSPPLCGNDTVLGYIRSSLYRIWISSDGWEEIFPPEYKKLSKRLITMPTPCPCNNCGNEITDPDFRVVLYNEEYPDIEIGPYCERCYGLIKICSGCQRPVLATDTVHTGNGEHFCSSCRSSFVTCEECGERKPEGAMRDINNKHVCTSCLSNHYRKCTICNEYERKDRCVHKKDLEGMRRAGIFRKYGDIVCQSCFEKKKRFFKLYDIEQCTHCGKNYSYSDAQVSPKQYCPDCYTRFSQCEECGEKHPDVHSCTFMDETSHLVRKKMCNKCASKILYSCACCGSAWVKSTGTLSKSKGRVFLLCPNCKDGRECSNCGTFSGSLHNGLCNKCHKTYVTNVCSNCGRLCDVNGRCRVCYSTDIYNYSYKPPIFYNYIKEKEDKVGNIFFGFENECTYGSGGDSLRYDKLKEMYSQYDPSILVAKSDGSINGYGYEVVSQPMSLLYFHGLDLSGILPKELKKDSSCGLHVHVGRTSFASEVHLYKVINFLHKNKKFSVYVAGRDNNGYCTAIGKKPSKHLKDSKSGNTERRCMVNLTNKHTVEFRFFAGCVKEFELRARIETLHAIISFCREVPIHLSGDLDEFKKYVDNHAKMYPNAYTLIQKHA